MPYGIYKRTEYHREICRKSSAFQKGFTPWNKGKTGIYSKETLLKMSKASKGRTAWNKGKKFPEWSGENNSFYGEHHSLKTKIHLSKIKKGKNLGKNSSNWKGGRHIHTNGYIVIRHMNHPTAFKSGYAYEHRLVLEKKLGRYLKHEEHTHHINGIRTDNRPENLILTNNNDHRKFYH
jgi:hypothetical protein